MEQGDKEKRIIRQIEDAKIIELFDTEVIEEEKDATNGAIYQAIYLNIKVRSLPKLRIFLWIGRPALQGALPTVLHIHGGTQTASLEQVKQWASQGYMACSYDWHGNIKDRKWYTDLAGLPAGELHQEYNPENSEMLGRLLLAIVVASWLTNNPNVNAQNIGVYGISWGGSLTWLLNYYDTRLKAVAPIYGCGKHLNSGRLYINRRQTERPGDLAQWAQYLDGFNFAHRQNAPVFYISSTNDFWGWFDTGCEMVAQLPGSTCQASFSVNQNHHLDEWAKSSLNLWMNYHLRNGTRLPTAPRLQVILNEDGILRANFLTETNAAIPQKVRFCWSWGDMAEIQPPGRYWHSSEINSDERTSAGLEIPVYNTQGVLYIYLDAVYATGFKCSSLPLRVCPAFLGMNETTTGFNKTLADLTNDCDGWYSPAMQTDPTAAEFTYRRIGGPDNTTALTVEVPGHPFTLATFKPVDPIWHAHQDYQGLRFRLFNASAGHWLFTAVYRPEQSGQKIWQTNYEPIETGWQDLTLWHHQWIDNEGNSLISWDKLHKLTVGFLPHSKDLTALEDRNESENRNLNALGTVEWVTE